MLMTILMFLSELMCMFLCMVVFICSGHISSDMPGG